MNLTPAVIDSITLDDRQRRIFRIAIPGLTDGATQKPEAQLLSAIGDKSEDTEVRILVGDRVWLAYQNGDTRYPIIVGFRNREDGANAIDWRRFAHANFEFTADGQFVINTLNAVVNASGNVDVNTQGATTVTTQGDTTIATQGKTNVTSQGDTTISSEGKMTVSASGELDVTSSGTVKITAATINMSGS